MNHHYEENQHQAKEKEWAKKNNAAPLQKEMFLRMATVVVVPSTTTSIPLLPLSEVEGTHALYDWWAVVCWAHPNVPAGDCPAHSFEEATENTSLSFVKAMTIYAFLQDFLQVHHPDPITSLYLYGKDWVLIEDFVYPPPGVDIKAGPDDESVDSSATELFTLSQKDNGPSSPMKRMMTII